MDIFFNYYSDTSLKLEDAKKISGQTKGHLSAENFSRNFLKKECDLAEIASFGIGNPLSETILQQNCLVCIKVAGS